MAKIIPITEAQPSAIYFVECWEGHNPASPVFIEREPEDMTFARTVRDIERGEIRRAKRVIGVDLAAGKSWDASREAAKAMLDRFDSDDITKFSAEFIEEHLGFAIAAPCWAQVERGRSVWSA